MCLRESAERYSSVFFFSSRRRHTRFSRDWSSDVCSSDLGLDETDRGIEERAAREPAQTRVVEIHRGVDQDARMLACEVQMEEPDDLLGEILCAAMREREQSPADDEDQHALRGFERRDGADSYGRFRCVGHAVSRTATRSGASQRSGRKVSRRSAITASGFSAGAKWPPEACSRTSLTSK